jgi:type 1 glutamine amidotransferase
LSWTHVEQPAAAQLLAPERTRDFAAILFYDVPGIRFRTPQPPEFSEPDADMKRGIEALLASGKPLVFLHHAMAGWPAWDRYAEIIGARFFYQAGQYKGRSYADSGYVFPVTYRVEAAAQHPILEGLQSGFELTDELYLFELLDDRSVPLLRAKFEFCQEQFYSAAEALRGRMWSRADWHHPKGTDLIAWVRRIGRSPIVVIQCGNDGATFADPNFRRLVRNAIDWATSADAAHWAAGGGSRGDGA